MPIIKKPFSLSPLNDNPLVLSQADATTINITGGFSHKGGFPTIKFSIPPQPTMLEIGSLKFTGQILVKQANGSALISNNANGDYSSGRGGTNNNSGAIEQTNDNMIPQTALNIPNWGGVKNVIDKVVIQSKKSLIELSSVNNYGQYVGLNEAYSNNPDDYLISPLTHSLSGGSKAGKTNRRLLSCAMLGNTQASSIKSANSRQIGQFFSIPIQIDLMGMDNLFLDDDYLGGLLITIHLASDNQFFHNRFNRSDATSGGNFVVNNDMSALSYSLKNIKLEGRYLVPDQNDMANVPSVMSLDSRLNLINDVHSSVNANSYTPQLQAVKSVVNVFMDSDQTNTFTKNSNNFRMAPGLGSYQQARNGLRFPYNYETFNKPNADSSVENGAGSNGEKVLHFPALQYGDCEVRKQFETALLNGGKPYHSSVGIGLTNAALSQDIEDGALTDGLKVDNTIADCVGVGVDYTLGVGITQNYVNQDYNLTLKSKVNTGSSKVSANRNGGITSNPLLQQSFVRYNSQFDTESLVKVI